MLRIEGLVAGYQADSSVLRELSLELGERDIVALMGRNGMGKTTLLRTVMGHLKPSRGRIEFAGRDLVRRKPYEINKLGIGYVPQGRELFDAFTVEQNLLLGLFGKRGLRATVPDWIYDYFPILHERRRQRAGTLSGGEQQQLAIARTLIGRPRLLLLDEPSEGIQPSIVQMIGRTVRAIAEKEALAVLVVEQNIDLVMLMARHCLFIENGRIADSADTERLRADAGLIHKYLSV